MEDKPSLFDPLLERAEEYSKTSYELLRLKSVDTTARVASAFLSRLLLVVVLLFFVFILQTGIALWLGDLLGKSYYGFLLVALFDGLIGVILYFIRPLIKARLSNLIIAQLLN